jgi:hypothetical protein
MNNQQNQSTQPTQTNDPLDFFLNPINIGDYVGEAYQGGIRIGKVLKITEKTIFLSCRREQSKWNKTPYVASHGMENISKAIAEIKEHNGKRPVVRYKWISDAQTNLINFTSLNLLSDEIIENRV